MNHSLFRYWSQSKLAYRLWGSFLKQVLQRHVLHVLTVLLALCLHNVVLNYVNTHYKDSASVMMTTNILTLSLSSTIFPRTHRSKAENVHQDPSRLERNRHLRLVNQIFSFNDGSGTCRKRDKWAKRNGGNLSDPFPLPSLTFWDEQNAFVSRF